MSLPWLESMPVWGAETTAARPPQRFAALFMGNGVHQTEWYAKDAGKDMQFGNCLKSLEPLKDKVNVISGLFNKNATGVGIHPGQTVNILSGVSLQKGAVLKGGISIDEMLAKRYEKEAVQSSIGPPACSCLSPEFRVGQLELLEAAAWDSGSPGSGFRCGPVAQLVRASA